MTLVEEYGKDLDDTFKYRLLLLEHTMDDPATAIVMLDKVLETFDEQSVKIPAALKQELNTRKTQLKHDLEKSIQDKKSQLQLLRTEIKKPEKKEVSKGTTKTHEIFGD